MKNVNTKKKSKYLSKKIEYNGLKFDSKKECNRYVDLLGQLENGEIQDLKLQVKYVLIPAQREPSTYNSRGREILGKVKERECSYIADFVYEKDGKTVVEDVKGYRFGNAYTIFTIKRKLMLYRYGIEVQEV